MLTLSTNSVSCGKSTLNCQANDQKKTKSYTGFGLFYVNLRAAFLSNSYLKKRS
ncbi:Uncharacterised protein [Streptococcus pseudoporcinus]|nr:Uncharacterised protein [Streptococcus pseudoporcinus]